MKSLKLQIQSAPDGYSAACITNFADLESRELAEEILAITALFSDRIPVSARCNSTPIEKLGEITCGRIIHKIMNGRPIAAVKKYETANVRFEGVALGVVAVIAMNGLGGFETQMAERSIKFLVELMAGERPDVMPFSISLEGKYVETHPQLDNFLKSYIGEQYNFTAGIIQGLKYLAKKSGDQISIISLEPLEDKFFNRV